MFYLFLYRSNELKDSTVAITDKWPTESSDIAPDAGLRFTGRGNTSNIEGPT